MGIDFRECLYALSDVIINRPPPLRVYDQIYMKLPDMLLHAELVSRWFDGKRALFVGDGDAIALTLVHLSALGLLPGVPAHVTVLDFDERVVNSINNLARQKGLDKKIDGVLYNVADPLPVNCWQAFDAFHTNPPWGASNQGNSVRAFIRRGLEGVTGRSVGCIVIGDHPGYGWTHDVQKVTETLLLEAGYRIAEVLPQFHRYHLDDAPKLTSCAMIAESDIVASRGYDSLPLSEGDLHNFYGADHPLKIRYVRDLTNGGKLVTHDVSMTEL